MANHGDKGNVEDFSVSAPLAPMATRFLGYERFALFPTSVACPTGIGAGRTIRGATAELGLETGVQMQTHGRKIMSRAIVASFVVLLVGGAPAAAQIAREQIPATTQMDKSLIGLPLVTSDGETVGYITEVGIDDGQAIAIAEIVRLLGIGYDVIAIPMEMFAHKGDHAELTITGEEIRGRLKRPEN